MLMLRITLKKKEEEEEEEEKKFAKDCMNASASHRILKKRVQLLHSASHCKKKLAYDCDRALRTAIFFLSLKKLFFDFTSESFLLCCHGDVIQNEK